jgi:hypothetical protein
LIAQRRILAAVYMDVLSNRRAWHYIVEVIVAAQVEKVWEIGSDWLSFPARSCVLECTEGENGLPGCVRKVTVKSRSGSPDKERRWVAEKLIHIDHSRHILFYDVVGGNIGLEPGYQAAFQVVGEGEGRTRVVWSFRFSPKQAAIEQMTPPIAARITAYIQELETLASA